RASRPKRTSCTGTGTCSTYLPARSASRRAGPAKTRRSGWAAVSSGYSFTARSTRRTSRRFFARTRTSSCERTVPTASPSYGPQPRSMSNDRGVRGTFFSGTSCGQWPIARRAISRRTPTGGHGKSPSSSQGFLPASGPCPPPSLLDPREVPGGARPPRRHGQPGRHGGRERRPPELRFEELERLHALRALEVVPGDPVLLVRLAPLAGLPDPERRETPPPPAAPPP